MINNTIIPSTGGGGKELTTKNVGAVFYNSAPYIISYTTLQNGELVPSYKESTGSSIFVNAVVDTTITLVSEASGLSYVGLTSIKSIYKNNYTVHILKPTV